MLDEALKRHIGDETGRAEVVVTDAMLDDYLATMELDPALLAPFEANRRRAIPADMLAKSVMTTLYMDYFYRVIGAPLRAKQDFTFHAPALTGTRFTAIATVADIYEKRGRNFVVFEGRFTDEAGTTVLTDRRTVMIVPPNSKLM